MASEQNNIYSLVMKEKDVSLKEKTEELSRCQSQIEVLNQRLEGKMIEVKDLNDQLLAALTKESLRNAIEEEEKEEIEIEIGKMTSLETVEGGGGSGVGGGVEVVVSPSELLIASQLSNSDDTSAVASAAVTTKVEEINDIGRDYNNSSSSRSKKSNSNSNNNDSSSNNEDNINNDVDELQFNDDTTNDGIDVSINETASANNSHVIISESEDLDNQVETDVNYAISIDAAAGGQAVVTPESGVSSLTASPVHRHRRAYRLGDAAGVSEEIDDVVEVDVVTTTTTTAATAIVVDEVDNNQVNEVNSIGDGGGEEGGEAEVEVVEEEEEGVTMAYLIEAIQVYRSRIARYRSERAVYIQERTDILANIEQYTETINSLEALTASQSRKVLKYSEYRRTIIVAFSNFRNKVAKYKCFATLKTLYLEGRMKKVATAWQEQSEKAVSNFIESTRTGGGGGNVKENDTSTSITDTTNTTTAINNNVATTTTTTTTNTTKVFVHMYNGSLLVSLEPSETSMTTRRTSMSGLTMLAFLQLIVWALVVLAFYFVVTSISGASRGREPVGGIL